VTHIFTNSLILDAAAGVSACVMRAVGKTWASSKAAARFIWIAYDKNGWFWRIALADWLLLNPVQTLPPAAGGQIG
jgi:hypothetical protein